MGRGGNIGSIFSRYKLLELAAERSGMTIEDVDKAVDAYERCAADAIVSGGKVYILAGRFLVSAKMTEPYKKAVGIQGGKEVDYPSRQRFVFKPSKSEKQE